MVSRQSLSKACDGRQQAGIANSVWTVQASVETAETCFTGNRRARFNRLVN